MPKDPSFRTNCNGVHTNDDTVYRIWVTECGQDRKRIGELVQPWIIERNYPWSNKDYGRCRKRPGDLEACHLCRIVTSAVFLRRVHVRSRHLSFLRVSVV